MMMAAAGKEAASASIRNRKRITLMVVMLGISGGKRGGGKEGKG
jgi:hypothetical protein